MWRCGVQQKLWRLMSDAPDVVRMDDVIILKALGAESSKLFGWRWFALISLTVLYQCTEKKKQD